MRFTAYSLSQTTGPEVVEDIRTSTDSTSLSVSWQPPDCPNGPISTYTITGYIQQFRTDRMRRSVSQMVNISADLRDCLTSSNREESFCVTVNSSQLSTTIRRLGMQQDTMLVE